MRNVCLVIFCLFLLSSCYDNREPNDIAYATAIGIDKGEKENYNITIQYAKPYNISGGETGGSGKDIMSSITVEAPDIYSGIGLGNHIISKSFDLSHLRLFVFSKDIAKKGISDFIETISRSKEIRPNVFTAVADGKASEYLSKASPTVDINPAKYYQLIYGKNDYRAIPKSYSQDLYFYINLPEKNSVLPLAAVPENAESKGKGEGSEESGEKEKPNPEHEKAPIEDNIYEYTVHNYKAGQVEVYSNSNSEVSGGAVFKDDKMVGELGLVDAQIYNMLTEPISRNYISFKTDKSDHLVTVLLDKEDRAKISYNKSTHTAKIYLRLGADFVSLPDDYIAEKDIEHFEKIATEGVKGEVERFIKKTQNVYDSDIVGFGLYAKSKFLTREDFEKYDWEEKYRTMSVDVEIELNVRRTGLTARE